jgi:hypothetical protein
MTSTVAPSHSYPVVEPGYAAGLEGALAAAFGGQAVKSSVDWRKEAIKANVSTPPYQDRGCLKIVDLIYYGIFYPSDDPMPICVLPHRSAFSTRRSRPAMS